MNSLHVALGCLCVLPFLALTSADGTFDLSLKDSTPVCVGTICDSSSAFHYYSCCGSAFSQCCFHLQQWVFITLIVIGAITVLSFLIGMNPPLLA
ncbi:hypothetical protein M3Y99_00887200 [Aphelenchoides fujianensis]|nr:hypothetical protein M3Y99_00887200 [Aphelenchoides fujianensis]